MPLVALKKVANSLYFLPASLTAFSIALAVALLALDKNFASLRQSKEDYIAHQYIQNR